MVIKNQTDILDLSFKNLSKLTLAITSYENLKIINLTGNNFKYIPDLVFNCKNLKVLNVSNNNLSSISPKISQLLNLEHFIINGNNLKEIPSELCKLKKLVILESWNNKINKIPDDIWNMPSLTTLNLSLNQLSTLPILTQKNTSLKHLSLHRNILKSLPDTLYYLKGLISLNLNNNHLYILPIFILGIHHLNRLDIGFNLIKFIPTEITKLRKLRYLYLVGNPLVNLPKKILSMSKLKVVTDADPEGDVYDEALSSSCSISSLYPDTKTKNITLIYGNLVSIPDDIFAYSQIETLTIYNNKIRYISDNIGKLSSLKELYIGNNVIKTLPLSLSKLKKLEVLFLHNNLITTVPPEIVFLPRLKSLDLSGNPITMPPLEICAHGLPAMRNYYEAIQSNQDIVTINHAKVLFLGDAGVGKTSLIKKITHNLNIPLNYDEPVTKGIERKSISFEQLNKKTYNADLWDFGGQNVYHHTHQFFLSKRSVYVLVWDCRQTNSTTSVYYWLDLIKLYGKNSPVILVQNRKDLGENYLNYQLLKNTYNITGFIATSCKTNQGLKEFLELLQHTISELPHMNSRWPRDWLSIQQNLIKYPNPTISIEEYMEICNKKQINQQSAMVLLEWLHDLGIVLHFKNNLALSSTVICSPDWVTTAAYLLLSNPNECIENGILKESDLYHIWPNKVYQWKYHFLLQLMQEFEVCINLHHKNSWIIPDLLNHSSITDEFYVEVPDIQCYYEFEFLPYALIAKLIKFFNRSILYEDISKHHLKVRTGHANISFYQDEKNHKLLFIKIWAKEANLELLTIKSICDKINMQFNFQASFFISCSCTLCRNNNSSYYFSWKTLESYQEKNQHFIICEHSIEAVPLTTLIQSKNQKKETAILNHSSLNILSKKEKEITLLMYSFKSRKDISKELNITEKTLKKHLQHVYNKLSVSSQVALLQKLHNFNSTS